MEGWPLWLFSAWKSSECPIVCVQCSLIDSYSCPFVWATTSWELIERFFLQLTTLFTVYVRILTCRTYYFVLYRVGVEDNSCDLTEEVGCSGALVETCCYCSWLSGSSHTLRQVQRKLGGVKMDQTWQRVSQSQENMYILLPPPHRYFIPMFTHHGRSVTEFGKYCPNCCIPFCNRCQPRDTEVSKNTSARHIFHIPTAFGGFGGGGIVWWECEWIWGWGWGGTGVLVQEQSSRRWCGLKCRRYGCKSQLEYSISKTSILNLHMYKIYRTSLPESAYQLIVLWNGLTLIIKNLITWAVMLGNCLLCWI